MKRKANISLISKQYDGETTEQMELMTEGEIRYLADGYEISYRENMDSDFKGATTRLRYTQCELVTMTRSAPAPSELVIELGKKHHCHYSTPHGDFMVGVTAKSIVSEMKPDGGKLDFCYVIDVNSSYVGDFEININVKTVN